MAHRKWKETKLQPGTAGPGNMLGCCLLCFHFLWAIHPIRPEVKEIIILLDSCSQRAGSSSTSPSYHHSAADSLYHQYRTGLSYNTGGGSERRGGAGVGGNESTATEEVGKKDE